MIKDKEIRRLVSEIKSKCLVFLDYVESFNECAFSDRMIEEIINKSKELEDTHYKRFNQKSNEKSTKNERVER